MTKQSKRNLFTGVLPIACALLSASSVLTIAATTAQAQVEQGGISGVVQSEAGRGLAGARVEVTGTGQSTFSDRTGRYQLRNVPTGQQRLRFTFLSGETVELDVAVQAGLVISADATIVITSDAAIDQVIVTGERLLGINQERAAINKKNFLTSEKAADLPDINAAEAIQRLPGVYIDEERGEGRFVSIRGAGSSFNRVKLNGLSIGSPESNGLAVPLDVFPAGAISTIEITKSVTPAQDANSVGGEIALRTPTVFGSTPETSVQFRGGFHDLGGGKRLRGRANTEYIFGSDDQFAVALSGAYSVRNLLAETVESSDWDLEDDVPGFEGQEIWVVDDLELRHQEVERERLTVTGILEWKPGENSRLFAQGTFSRFEEDEFRSRLITHLEDDFDEYDATRPITVTPPSAASEFNADTGEPLPRLPAATRITFLGAEEREIDFQRDFTPQNFIIVSAGGEWRNEEWEFSADAGFSRTTEKRERNSLDFENTETFDLEFDSTADPLVPALTVVGGGDILDPSTMEFQDFDNLSDIRIDEFVTLSADASHFGDFMDRELTLQFGTRVTLRDRSVTVTDTDFNSGAEDLFLSDPRFLRENLNDNFLKGAYVFGPGISQSGLALISDNPGGLLTFNNIGGADENYVATENVFAGYVQGTYKIEDLTILAGVRVEHTDFDIDGFEVVEIDIVDADDNTVLAVEEITPLSGAQKYTNVFPGVHLRYDVNENVILRASAAKTIRRPNFNALVPEGSVEVTQDDTASGDEARVIESSRGNPNLEPLISWNYEVSIDTYFEKFGAFGVAFFYKDVSNITVGTVIESTAAAGDLPANVLALAGGALNGTFTVFESTVASESTGKIKGIELSYSKKFVELPSPFDGLGIDANVTLTDSEQTVPVFDGLDLIGTTEFPFEGQADYSGNVTLSYEKGRFEARVTYAFISEFLQDIDFEDEENLIAETEYDLSFKRLGAKVQYHLTDAITLTWEGNNFNDRNLRRYHVDPAQLRENERNGWWMEFGVEVAF